MADDPIGIKPSFGWITLNLNEFWRRWRAKPEATSVVVRRFLDLFQWHGVQPTQIQRILPQVTLDKLRSPDALLSLLSNELLDQTAALFNVRREWLEGVDEQVYPCRTCYKNSRKFFEDLAELELNYDSYPVRAVYSGKGLDARSSACQNLVLILVERVCQIGEEDIDRYRVYSDAWDWSYAPCRIQLKAMARLVFLNLDTPVPLYRAEAQIVENIREGRLVPRTALEGSLHTEPSLEDFALALGTGVSEGRSAQAKEVEELPAVLRYIQERQLETAVPRRSQP